MNTTCDQLITDNLQYAKNVARQHRHSFVGYDEIEAAAFMGLVEAARKYDPEKNDEFAAYAYPRIVGAIRDYLRELRWGSRSNPVTVAEVYIYEEELCQPEERREDGFFDKLTVNLTKTNKTVMRQYYVDELKIREIATIMGVNESRVSQVLTESRVKLKRSWQARESELWAEVA